MHVVAQKPDSSLSYNTYTYLPTVTTRRHLGSTCSCSSPHATSDPLRQGSCIHVCGCGIHASAAEESRSGRLSVRAFSNLLSLSSSSPAAPVRGILWSLSSKRRVRRRRHASHDCSAHIVVVFLSQEWEYTYRSRRRRRRRRRRREKEKPRDSPRTTQNGTEPHYVTVIHLCLHRTCGVCCVVRVWEVLLMLADAG